ncbi:3-methyl-2-oxobutanoate hydroxymethyltransferase [Flavobacterium filum]|uniref:3-methyl-2-oxobutanoate hydroxymethyltransferase n=1 Tax=Flavobacterium filum TaxID=370974 RepID=UPI00041C20A0|nr:3-methyl-2-oxobutanoate hydroxymethyltransferase [Flavobacterium filum]
MKKVSFLILVLFFQFSFSQESEIQLTIGKFFNAFHQRDSIALKKVCSENLILHSISESEKGAKFSVEKAANFYKSIATIPLSMKFEEKILSYKVQIDGTMAHVWTPYEFYVNDKLSHSGVNSFQLYKENDGWKVVYILDTRRK